MIAPKKSIRLRPVFIKKRFEVEKTYFFLPQKMKNLINCISDYAHSFYGVDFKSNPLY